MSLSFKLPGFAHPDETVKVKMTSENVGDSRITLLWACLSLPVI